VLEEMQECAEGKAKSMLKERLGMCWRKMRSVLEERIGECRRNV
jgi:hypothetical protein